MSTSYWTSSLYLILQLIYVSNLTFFLICSSSLPSCVDVFKSHFRIHIPTFLDYFIRPEISNFRLNWYFLILTKSTHAASFELQFDTLMTTVPLIFPIEMCSTNFVEKWNFEALEFNLKGLKSRKKAIIIVFSG